MCIREIIENIQFKTRFCKILEVIIEVGFLSRWSLGWWIKWKKLFWHWGTYFKYILMTVYYSILTIAPMYFVSIKLCADIHWYVQFSPEYCNVINKMNCHMAMYWTRCKLTKCSCHMQIQWLTNYLVGTFYSAFQIVDARLFMTRNTYSCLLLSTPVWHNEECHSQTAHEDIRGRIKLSWCTSHAI